MLRDGIFYQPPTTNPNHPLPKVIGTPPVALFVVSQ